MLSFVDLPRSASERVPGVVASHIPAATGRYVGSPSIVALDSDTYLMSHDIFGHRSSYDTVRIVRSTDRGATWQPLAQVRDQFWSNLFVHRDALYLMGTNRRFGYVAIRRSDDAGATWTTPRDRRSGILREDGWYHTAPMPVIEHAGRLWRSMEDLHPEITWGRAFRAFVMSVLVDADLLQAESWRSSRKLACDTAWLNGHFGGWLEGNAVVAPDGGVVDMLRVDCKASETEYAAIVRIGEEGQESAFDPQDIVELPGGCKKFTIRYDPASDRYWTLANVTHGLTPGQPVSKHRNTLALLSSPDLRRWREERVVLSHPDVAAHAFQYVDWQFEAADLVVASRTAFDDGAGGAHNQHDANFLTFHRVERFRSAC